MASSPCLSDTTLELSPAWSRFGVSPASPPNLGDVATPPRGTKKSQEAMLMTPPRPTKKNVGKSPKGKSEPSKSTSLSPKSLKGSPRAMTVAAAMKSSPSSASSPTKRSPMKAMKVGMPGKLAQAKVKKCMKVIPVKKTVMMKRVSEKKGAVKGMKKPASKKGSMKKPVVNPKAECFDDYDSFDEMHRNHDDDGTNWVSKKSQVELDNLLHETHAEWVPYFDFSASFKVDGNYIGAESFKQFMIGTLETDGWKRIKSGKKFEHWEKIEPQHRSKKQNKNNKDKTGKKNK
eukprot:s3482_g9.t1